MMPSAFVDSEFWCRYCQKRMIVERGQHEEHGYLVESHSCLNCGRVYNRALSLRGAGRPVDDDAA